MFPGVRRIPWSWKSDSVKLEIRSKFLKSTVKRISVGYLAQMILFGFNTKMRKYSEIYIFPWYLYLSFLCLHFAFIFYNLLSA